MKRKLIDFDSFQKIRNESFTNTQTELEAAAPLLASALGLDDLALESYDNEAVLFETVEGEFVHAKYDINNGFVKFEDIEQLVLNEENELKHSREVISEMLDALIESNESKADKLFAEWMDLPRTKRLFSEARKLVAVPVRDSKGNIKKYRKAWRNTTPKHHEPAGMTARRMRGKKIKQRRRPKAVSNALKMKRAIVNRSIGKHMKEWSVIAENVIGFVDLKTNGPEVNNIQTLSKEGQIVAVKVPTIALRNEARILKFDWKTLNTDLVIKRGESKKMNENENFAKAIADLKRLNAISDTKELETALENAATNFPGVLYLTERELAEQVKSALENIGATNFDDESCAFIAEGLLRTAHDAFIDRVAKIVKLAGGKLNEDAEDKYASFRNIADEFYKNLDESAELEMQAFVDVYESLRQVHELAKEENNADLANETAEHLDDLLPIITGKSEMDLEALGDAAAWLYDVAEATQPEDWKVGEPYVTADGEHPDLAKKARQYQSPAEMEGNTPEFQHTSSGKGSDSAAAKELGSDGWSNLGGEGVYPELDNPYVPKSETPKIVGEKSVDSDSEQLAHWGSDDTWPNLNNPYSKASVTPKSVKE